MTVRSHVDPFLFVVFMNVKRTHMDEEIEEILRTISLEEGDSLDDLLHRLNPRQDQVSFHETYHYWQGLRLPFVLWHAILAFRIVALGFKELAQHSEDFDTWSCLMPQLHRLELEHQVGCTPERGDFFFAGPDADIPAGSTVAKINPLELIECAASIAEFQVACKDDEQRTTPLAFQRWCKRNPATLGPYKLAVSLLENEAFVLRTLLPLINRSFHTTQPERAFIELIGHAWNLIHSSDENIEQVLAHPEPMNWPALLDSWLDNLEFEAEPDSSGDVLQAGYHRLTLQQWAGGGYGNKEANHPFISEPAKRWIEFESKNPQLTSIIDFPGWFPEFIPLAREGFSPPLTVYKFHFADGSSRVLLYGRGIKNWAFGTQFEEWETTGWKDIAADLMAQFGAVRKASSAAFDENQRTCGHAECPHYTSNLCNSYPIVPENWQECGFPKRIANQISIFRGLE